MAVKQFTYKQLDNVLSRLGFTRQKAHARNRTWLYYEHADSKAEIIVVEKKPNEFVSGPAALSARRQLIERGLVDEEELDEMLLGKKKRPAALKKK